MTNFIETEALLLALEHGESEVLFDYLITNFLPNELLALARACSALKWSCNDVRNRMVIERNRA